MEKSRNKGELSREKTDKRSRSRSPKHSHSRRSSKDKRSNSFFADRNERRRRSRSRSSSSSSDSDDYSHRKHSRKSSSDSRDSQKLSVPPPPKISVNLGKESSSIVSTSFKKPIAGISLKLNASTAKSSQPKLTVANAFNNESDEEVEEMPAECKMRMKNIGRMTPTSSGPNSFGKTKLGFVDTKKMYEKKMQEMLNDLGD